MSTFDRDVAGIGALGDDLRRRLYRFVSGRSEPVTREQAAKALDISLHRAKFGLDRLTDTGLLAAEYVRVSGRSGPGAGRPAKLYRRSPREFSVTLPDREYELAGRLMAAAIADTAGSSTPVLAALDRAATAEGRQIGRAAAAGRAAAGGSVVDRDDGDDGADEEVIRTLREHGYEPRRSGSRVILANCPFHALVGEHPGLVCRMNHELLCGVVDAVTDAGADGAPGGGIRVRLDPGDDRCCVVLDLDDARRDDRDHNGK